MFQDAYAWIAQFLSDNQIASGGITIALFTSSLWLMRKVPEQIVNLAKRRLVMHVEILDQDPAFAWFNRWLAAHDYMKRSRRLGVVTRFSHRGREDAPNEPARVGDYKKQQPEIHFVPAPGTHIVRHKGCWMMVNRNRQEPGSGGDDAFLRSMRPESYDIHALYRHKAEVVDMLDEARSMSQPDTEDMQEVWIGMNFGSWRRVGATQARSLSSVFTTDGIASELACDLKRFRESRDWYRGRGVPWRRGILLHGPPGNGKTSLIRAIANELGMAVGVINLGQEISDSSLNELLTDAGPETLIVMEDVDCVFQKREKTDDTSDKLSFSGMLNAIDGVASGEGRIIAMTTNYPERIDEALKRPGRCDLVRHLGPPEPEQAAAMFRHFFPDAPESDARQFGAQMADGQRSMAAIQNHLLVHSDSPRTALEAAWQQSAEASPDCRTSA